MKKIFIVAFLSLLFLILDNALMPFLSIKGVYPSLLFVFVLCYSIINGSWSAIFVGVFSGLLQDIYLIDVTGISILINMFMCLLAADIGKNIFKDRSLIPVVACFLLSILKGILMFLLLYIIGKHFDIKLVFYRSIYNCIVSIIMYKFVYKLCQKKYMIKNWRF